MGVDRRAEERKFVGEAEDVAELAGFVAGGEGVRPLGKGIIAAPREDEGGEEAGGGGRQAGTPAEERPAAAIGAAYFSALRGRPAGLPDCPGCHFAIGESPA